MRRAVVINLAEEDAVEAGFAGDRRPRAAFFGPRGRGRERGHLDERLADALRDAYRRLGVASRTQPLLITDAGDDDDLRERLAALAFAELRVPALQIRDATAAALRLSGSDSGAVCLIGDGRTTVAALRDGARLPGTIRLDLGGRHVGERLAELLRARGVELDAAATRAARAALRKIGFVALDYDEELRPRPGLGLDDDDEEMRPRSAVGPGDDERRPRRPDLRPGADDERRPTVRHANLSLPGGPVIALGIERFQAPEVLFRPSLLGLEQEGIHAAVHRLIDGAAPGLRAALLGNVVVAGKGSMIADIDKRLARELAALGPDAMTIEVVAPSIREHAVFIGAAELAEAAPADAWLTRDEYDEAGPAKLRDA
jgi:actin-related protein